MPPIIAGSSETPVAVKFYEVFKDEVNEFRTTGRCE
jgi:hypothetical protein